MLDGCGGEVDQMPQVDLPIEVRAADPRGGPSTEWGESDHTANMAERPSWVESCHKQRVS